MKRWAAGVLLLLLPLTLAPRTSWELGDGWRADVAVDRVQGATSGVNPLVFAVIPPQTSWTTTAVRVSITSSGTWALVSASPGCQRIGDVVSCTLVNSGPYRQRVIRLAVRALGGGALSYSLSKAATV